MTKTLKEISLEKISIFFLVVPCYVFFFGWLRLFPACVLTVVFSAGIALMFRNIERTDNVMELPENRPFYRYVLISGAVALIWVGLSGAAGAGFINLGLIKNNSLMADLIVRPWPVAYVSVKDGVIKPLVTSFLFYLPAAFVGKVIGWKAANLALFIFTWLGATLSLLWFTILVGRRSFLIPLIFVVFGGMDVLGAAIFSGHIPSGTSHIEGWSGFWKYFSNTALLFWSPQQGLAGWIATSLVVWQSLYRRSAANLIFLLGVTFLWCPFVALGLLPVVLASLWYLKFRDVLSFQNSAVSFFPILVGALYFLSAGQDVPHGWIHRFNDLHWNWPRLIFFYLLEFGLVGLACQYAPFEEKDRRKIYWRVVLLSLVLLPLYVIGKPYDLSLYGSVPCLFLFCVAVARNLVQRKNDLNFRFLALFVFLGSFSALSEFSRSLAHYQIRIQSLEKVRSLNQYFSFDGEFGGDADKWFFRFLAKPLKISDFAKEALMTKDYKDTLAIIEAEDYENITHRNHIQDNPYEPGEKLVDNGFGETTDDHLAYTFWVNEDAQNAVLIAMCATLAESAKLDVVIDDGRVGTLDCRKTGNWWNFVDNQLNVGPLSRGGHKLCVQSNGINVNIDSFIVRKVHEDVQLIEAENNENKTRLDHRQSSDWAHGGKLIGNDFGSHREDYLSYSFYLDHPLQKGFVAAAYATMKNKASFHLFVDNVSLGKITCGNTEDWFFFIEDTLPLHELPAGWHQLRIQPDGVNINFDYFVIRPTSSMTEK